MEIGNMRKLIQRFYLARHHPPVIQETPNQEYSTRLHRDGLNHFEEGEIKLRSQLSDLLGSSEKRKINGKIVFIVKLNTRLIGWMENFRFWKKIDLRAIKGSLTKYAKKIQFKLAGEIWGETP